MWLELIENATSHCHSYDHDILCITLTYTCYANLDPNTINYTASVTCCELSGMKFNLYVLVYHTLTMNSPPYTQPNTKPYTQPNTNITPSNTFTQDADVAMITSKHIQAAR